jgi:hypothetical protein
MQCNSNDLLEVLTIISQYETDAYVYTDRKGVLHIDGSQASTKMSQYERSRLTRLGFETGERFGIRQVILKQKTEGV